MYSVCLFLRMIRSSFKSENFVLMQVFTASSFWPETYNLSVHNTLYTVQRYYESHFVMTPRIHFHFYSAFVFFARIYEDFLNGKNFEQIFSNFMYIFGGL